MTTPICRSLISITLAVVLSANAAAQQSKQSNQEFLQAKSRRFINYGTDFAAFARGSNLEWEIPMDLGNIAASTGDFITAAQAFLDIYDQLSCQADRSKTWSVIKRNLDYYGKQIDNFVKTVNNGLSFTKAPAVATSGTQMKEDLRELKAFFESIQPN